MAFGPEIRWFGKYCAQPFPSDHPISTSEIINSPSLSESARNPAPTRDSYHYNPQTISACRTHLL